MRADTEPMTWMDVDAPALGGARSGATRPPQGRDRTSEPGTGPGGRGQAHPAPAHRRVPAADRRGGRALRSTRRGRTAASSRGSVSLASVGVARGATQRLTAGSDAEPARRQASRAQPPSHVPELPHSASRVGTKNGSGEVPGRDRPESGDSSLPRGSGSPRGMQCSGQGRPAGRGDACVASVHRFAKRDDRSHQG